MEIEDGAAWASILARINFSTQSASCVCSMLYFLNHQRSLCVHFCISVLVY